MNGKRMAISVVVAALLVLPQVLAMDAGITGNAGSSSLTYSSTVGSAVSEKNTLSKTSLSSTGSVIFNAGVLNKYFEQNSNDGNEKAAVYAYLTAAAGPWHYSITSTAGLNYATAVMDFGALTTGPFLVGGFAYNPTDYAAANAYGTSAASVSDKITVSAYSSKVSAGQVLSGTDFTDLYANTWAERGQLASEVTDETGANDMWTAVQALVPGAIVPLDVPFYGGMAPVTGGRWASQSLQMDAGSIPAAAGYKATATITTTSAGSATATASGTTTGTSTAAAGNYVTQFLGDSLTGDYGTGFEATTTLRGEFSNTNLNSVKYAGTATSTAAQATAAQTVATVNKANSARIGATTSDYKNYIFSRGQLLATDLVSAAPAVYATGTYTATAKTGSTSVVQTIGSAKAASIIKTSFADAGGLYTVDAATAPNRITIASAAATLPTYPALSGQSTITATLTDASIISKTPYRAVLHTATADTITRNAVATRGTTVDTLATQFRAPAVTTQTYVLVENFKVGKSVAPSVTTGSTITP